MSFILLYLLIASSFAIASYFFIHIPALKQSQLTNDLGYSIGYLLTAFIGFPYLFYGWAIDRELFIKELYNGFVSI